MTAERHVILYLPGTMRAFFDQSIDLVAHHLANALSIKGSNQYRADGLAETLVIKPGIELKRRRLSGTADNTQTIDILEYDYTPRLAATLNDNGVLSQVLQFLWLALRMTPTVGRLICLHLPAGHTQLKPVHRLFVAFIYAASVLALVSIGSLAFSLIKGGLGTIQKQLLECVVCRLHLPGFMLGELPQQSPNFDDTEIILAVLGAVFTFVISLVPVRWPQKFLGIGREYFGVTRYLLAREKEAAITAEIGEVIKFMQAQYPKAQYNLLAFSMGAVVAANHLFPRQADPAPSTPPWRHVIIMGFPYIIITAAFRRYFKERQMPRMKFEWHNIFLTDDILGSRLKSHLPEMFGASSGRLILSIDEQSVEAQAKKNEGVIKRHMAYWGDDSVGPSGAFHVCAEMLLR